MKVLKFGGTSVGNIENLQRVKEILHAQTDNFIVVVSAFSGVTDLLQNLAHSALNQFPNEDFANLKNRNNAMMLQLISQKNQEKVTTILEEKYHQIETLCYGIHAIQELSDRTLAKMMSFGEILSSNIIFHFLIENNIEIELLHIQSLIKTTGDFSDGLVQITETYQNIKKQADSSKNYIAPGFIASNNKNETTLLGRGGSDYTASLIGAALEVKTVEIWSDVNGMLNANPKVVSNAHTITDLSYEEALELSHFGAKVLYQKSVKPLKNKNIPIYLKNTFFPNEIGTKISSDSALDENIKGISSLSNISILTFSGSALYGNKGTTQKVFKCLEKINIILITQSSSEQDICIAISTNDVEKAKEKFNTEFEIELNAQTINSLQIENGFSVIALVGDSMKQKSGFSGKAFSVLGENGINISAIAQGSTERNISFIINEKDEEKAINVLHEKYFDDVTKKVHLFIAGIGNVGAEFLSILRKQKKSLLENFKIEIRVIGIANSKGMIWNDKGLNVNKKHEFIPYNTFADFVQKVTDANLRNSVFIDNTASEVVSNFYKNFLENSVSVVACNKIACASEYENYSSLINTAKEKNAQFKYETCVGAALPIINTIQHLILSGDKINKILACLSGSLNFIFNNYNTTVPFAEVVLQAKTEGYTEPNPLIDLSGLDVRRKILILARESANRLEMNEVKSLSFLPDSCLNAKNNDELFSELHKSEPHFKALYDAAHSKGNKLKVVAKYENGVASVGLEEIPPESPFFHLEGKDNIVSINTERYSEQPLVVKGAGAGAAVTASGVFSDLMLIINK